MFKNTFDLTFVCPKDCAHKVRHHLEVIFFASSYHGPELKRSI